MSDALERLKRRNRPTVPTRDTSLTPVPFDSVSQDTSIPSNLDIENSLIQNIQASISQDTQSPSYPEIAQPLETKQSTLRLERGVSDRLQEVCRENSICREVLIEAMFEYCEANLEALQAVLPEARKKNEQRQQIAN